MCVVVQSSHFNCFCLYKRIKPTEIPKLAPAQDRVLCACTYFIPGGISYNVLERKDIMRHRFREFAVKLYLLVILEATLLNSHQLVCLTIS